MMPRDGAAQVNRCRSAARVVNWRISWRRPIRSLVVAATNHPAILDSALFRRFDDILHYELPDEAQVVRLLRARLSGTVAKGVRWQHLADLAVGLSYAEITRASNEALKDALIHERPQVRETDIRTMLEERKSVAEKFE